MTGLADKYAQMYRRELADFAGRWPQYADPSRIELSIDSEAFASKFSMFGALCLIQGDLTTAKAWFRVARDSSLLLYRYKQNITPGWPPGTPKGDPRHHWVTVPKVCLYGRLLEKASGVQPYRAEVLEGLPYLFAEYEKELSEFLSFPPELDAAPSSNSRIISLEQQILLPGLFLRDDAAIAKAKLALDRILAWHEGVKASQERMDKAGFTALHRAHAYQSLLRGDARKFLERFVDASRRSNYQRRDAYMEHCNVYLLAFFLQANEMMGPLSPKGIRGIPADFDVERYWSA